MRSWGAPPVTNKFQQHAATGMTGEIHDVQVQVCLTDSRPLRAARIVDKLCKLTATDEVNDVAVTESIANWGIWTCNALSKLLILQRYWVKCGLALLRSLVQKTR